MLALLNLFRKREPALLIKSIESNAARGAVMLKSSQKNSEASLRHRSRLFMRVAVQSKLSLDLQDSLLHLPEWTPGF